MNADDIQKRAGRDDSHTFVLTNREEIRVAGHDERGATSDCAGDVLVIVRVCAESWNLEVVAEQLRQNNQVFKPQSDVDLRTGRLQHLGIGQGLENLSDDRLGQHQFERPIAQERLDDLTGRAFGIDVRADEDIGVQYDAQHRLFRFRARLRFATGPTLCLQRDLHRPIVRQRVALLSLHHVERVPTREAAHLLEPFHRYQRREGLAFALDDEFVLAQRDAIQYPIK